MRFTWVPSPQMNRPPDSSSRSAASMAVMVGDLGNASAIDVPTLILVVAWIATDAVTKALFWVSAAQQDSKPASSTILAIGPTSASDPPTPMPYSMAAPYWPRCLLAVPDAVWCAANQP
jgi:hypothetical protein